MEKSRLALEEFSFQIYTQPYIMQIFIYDTIFDKQRVGGISRYFSELTAELAKLPNVEIVLYVGKSTNIYLDALANSPSVRIIRFRNHFRLPKRVFAFCN